MRVFCQALIASLVALALGVVGTASAQSTASSSAFGESVNLNLLPLLGNGINITSGPLPTVAGTAPPSYNNNNSAASALVSSALTGQILQTGLLTVNAASSVPGSDTASASATVNNLEIDIVGNLPLLTIDATTVQSTANISGTCGSSLTATGTTTIENATVGGSLGVGLSISLNPPPNTVLLDLLGIRVVLNEQILAGDGVNSRSLTVNAIHITLDIIQPVLFLLGIDVLSGDIIISHSQAQLQCSAGGSADLAITKTDSPDPVTAGNNLTYLLTVTNSGPAQATGVVVTDTIPAGVSFVSATPSQGSCGPPNPITCNLGTINNGANATVTIVVTPTAAGPLSNTATVSGSQSDPNTSNNTDTEGTTVNPAPQTANLSLVKTDSPDPVTAGNPLTYVLTVTNGGPSQATGVTVTDTLPAGVTLNSATPSQGSCSGTSTVTCNLGTINNGANATVTIVVTPTAAGPLSNTAVVSGGQTDPDTSNNTDTEGTTVNPATQEQANLSLVKTDSPDPVTAGNNLTYLLTVTNGGPSAATSVVVTDTLPAGVNFVSATPSQGTCGSPNPIICNLGTINNGANATVTIVVTPTAAGPLSNIAVVSGGQTDPDTSNNSDTEGTTVNAGPTTTTSTTTTLPPQTIPTTGGWGMIILGAALLGSMTWMIQARRSIR